MIRGPRAETALTYSQTLNGQDVYVCLNLYVNIAHSTGRCGRGFKHLTAAVRYYIRSGNEALSGPFLVSKTGDAG